MDRELNASIKVVLSSNHVNEIDKLRTIASFFLLCLEKEYFLIFDMHQESKHSLTLTTDLLFNFFNDGLFKNS